MVAAFILTYYKHSMHNEKAKQQQAFWHGVCSVCLNLKPSMPDMLTINLCFSTEDSPPSYLLYPAILHPDYPLLLSYFCFSSIEWWVIGWLVSCCLLPLGEQCIFKRLVPACSLPTTLITCLPGWREMAIAACSLYLPFLSCCMSTCIRGVYAVV